MPFFSAIIENYITFTDRADESVWIWKKKNDEYDGERWTKCKIAIHLLMSIHTYTTGRAWSFETIQRYTLFTDPADRRLWINDEYQELQWTKSAIAIQLLKSIHAYTAGDGILLRVSCLRLGIF
jgi:hypothetical protein